jgi:hypothetical protein
MNCFSIVYSVVKKLVNWFWMSSAPNYYFFKIGAVWRWKKSYEWNSFSRLQRCHSREPYIQRSISSTFYARFFNQYPFAKKSQSQNVTREKLRKALSYKKFAHKMLMKSTPGWGNFPDVMVWFLIPNFLE